MNSRYLAEGGATLDVCQARSCPGDPNGRVSVLGTDGSVVRWYDGELAPDMVVDASFSADGRAVWLPLDRIGGGT